MTKLVHQTANYQASMRRPIEVDATAPASKLVKKTTAWWIKASSEVVYQGYLVEFTSVDPSLFEFRFIHADTGELVDGSVSSCDPTSLDEVYPYSPSVIPAEDELKAGKCIGYLFLRDRSLDPPHAEAETATAAAPPAESAIGKWPQSAEGDRLAELERAKLLTTDLLRLLVKPGDKLKLPPEILRELEHFGIEL
jgi:hypothetical protein